MLTLFTRALVLYITVVLVMRIMGKRQIGQLQPFEFVLAVLIADLAAVPMQDKEIPLINGLIPIFALTLGQVALSYITLKSSPARKLICGTPTVVIANGKIIEPALIGQMYNINDLLEHLRIKNCPNIADVEYAILETNGSLSVIPKSQKRPVNPSDLQINTKYEGLPIPLIIDGRPDLKTLTEANLDLQWLQGELAKFGIDRIKDVLFASLDSYGNLFYQKKTPQNKGE